MTRVESFELGRNTVEAPYVRLIGTEQNGNALVEKCDSCFLQSNKNALPTGALHTLEHLLVVNVRDELGGIIDISPMDYRTGLYMAIWGQHPPQKIRDASVNILNKVIDTGVVPVVSAKECGNYKDRSLFAAKEYTKIILDQGIGLDPFERIL